MKPSFNFVEYQQIRPMKTRLFCFLVFCLGFSALAQQFGPKQIIDPNNTSLVSKIVAADLDNDGFRDIVVSKKEFNNSKVSFYLNSGAGSFGPENILTTNVIYPEGVAAGDLDGNGWVDIVALSYNPNKVLLFPNSGGSFPTEILFDSGLIFPENVEITDIDNDGNLDVVVLSHSNILVYYNNGNGTFNKAITPNDQFEYYAFSIADLDGDGFKDILIGSGSVLVYMNDNGSFTAQDIPRSNSIVNQGLCFLVHTADLDGNGSMDLIIDGNGNSEISWYANDGNGFFTFVQSIETTVQCKSVSTADFNNDGSLDVFASLFQEGEVAWYANDGQGNFGSKQLVSTGIAPSTTITASADLDNNGSADVIWAHPFSFNLNNNLGLDGRTKIMEAINIWPNPFKGQLFIHTIEPTKLNVFDLQGRYIYQNIPIEAGTQSFSRGLPPTTLFL